jgi:hypothetical protein
VIEERVMLWIEELAALAQEGRDPVGVSLVQLEGKADKVFDVLASLHAFDGYAFVSHDYRPQG